MTELLPELVPGPALRGPAVVLGLGVLLVLALGLAPLFDRMRSRLAPTGVLPDLAWGLSACMRFVAVLVALGLVAAIVPPALAPAFPWAVIATAVALGWTARDGLRDVFAWVVVRGEGGIGPGAWITIGPHAGRVVRLGPRVLHLRDADGTHVMIPNRRLLTEAVRLRDTAHHATRARVRLPAGSAAAARACVEDALRLVPWAASTPITVSRHDDDTWVVDFEVLEPRFADRAAAALGERLRSEV